MYRGFGIFINLLLNIHNNCPLIEIKSQIGIIASTTPQGQQPQAVDRSDKPKLPKLSLPNFSNSKNESFRTFLTSFEDLISRYTLSENEKYMFLKDSVTGGPRILIENLDVANTEKYNAAVDLLKKAFDDEAQTKYDLTNKNL